MPILDGHKVDADQIDPCKHRCIGTWRPPAIPKQFDIPWREKTDESVFSMTPEQKAATECPCGRRLNLPGHCMYADLTEPFQHWQKGCFDEPQYVTINKGD